MKKFFLAIFCLSLCSISFAQKLSKDKTRDIISKLAHKQDMSASKTFSVPACLLDSMLGSYWDTVANGWKRVYKEAYTYDAQSNTATILYYNNNNSPAFIPTSSVNLSYNSQGTLTLSLSYSWEMSSSVWLPAGRTSYTYNASGDKINQYDEYWDVNNNVWVNSVLTSYSYTPTHSVTVELGQSWNTSSWTNGYKSTTSYNAASNPTLITYAIWESTTSTFDTLQKIMLTYTGNIMTSAHSVNWDQNTSTWANEFSYTYTYSGGNMTLEQEQSWVNGAWANSANYSYTYDSHNNMLTELDVIIDPETGDVTDQYLSQYYYRCNFVGIKEFATTVRFNLYPNPAQSTLVVQGATSFEACKILSINGQVVFESHENVTSIPVSHLEKGIYFIQLLDKNKTILATEKFVKE